MSQAGLVDRLQESWSELAGCTARAAPMMASLSSFSSSAVAPRPPRLCGSIDRPHQTSTVRF
jgi:hypothetical protein